LTASSPVIVHYAADVWGHVCPEIRLTAPAEQAGLTVIHGNEFDGHAIRVVEGALEQADVVYFQRDFPRHAEIYRPLLEQARRLGKPVIYDLDDLLMDLPEIHPDFAFYEQSRDHVLGAILEADAVTCPAPRMAETLRAFNPQVHILPNALNQAVWDIKTPEAIRARSSEQVTIGYMGGWSHRPDLEWITPVLLNLLLAYGSRLQLKFWGIAPAEILRGFPNVTFYDPGLVSYREFAAYFSQQSCDIFVAPLLDHTFNQCKSPIKYLEYSAQGIPGVFSKVGPYAWLVKDGETGYLADTPETWEARLKALIDDPALRQQMAVNALNDVKDHWLMQNQAAAWREFFTRLPQPAPRASSTTQRVFEVMQGWQNVRARQLAETRQQLAETRAELQRKEASLMRTLNEQQARIDFLTTDLNNIKGSAGFAVLMGVSKVRNRLAPNGSLREAALRKGLHGLRILKNEGPRGVLHRLKRAPGGSQAVVAPGQGLVYTVGGLTVRAELHEAFTPPAQPMVSVVLPLVEGSPAPKPTEIQAWLAAQTLQAAELIVWDRASGLLYAPDRGERAGEAPSFEAMLAHLQGKYVCFASNMLLLQPPTYLETNLLALESEALAFTLNLNGEMRGLAQGNLPGSRSLPFISQVVRRDALKHEGELDVAAWLSENGPNPAPVGKILTQAHKGAYGQEAWPREQHLTGASLLTAGAYLLAFDPNRPLMAQITHAVRGIPAALGSRVNSGKPTLFILMPFLAVGGVELLTLKLMHQLKDRVHFVVLTAEPLSREQGTTLDEFMRLTPHVYLMPDFLDRTAFYSFVQHLMRRFEPQTLYIANGANFIYDVLPTFRKEYPALRIVDQVYDHQYGWINRYNPEIAACMDACIASNQRIGQAYIQKGAANEKVQVVMNGVDLGELSQARYSDEQRAEIRRKLGLPADTRVVVFIARLHAQKRPLDFLELARRYTLDPSISFLMIGDGPLGGLVEAQKQKSNLTNLYRQSFYRPTSELFAISDVMVLPSEYEGMSMVTLEAQAMGVPVVSTDVGNNREIFDLTGGGLIVPRVGDLGALQSTLNQALRQPPDRERMARVMRERFALEVMAETYFKILLG